MKLEVNKEAITKKVDIWPNLPLEQWEETYSAIHLWTQIVGKIKLSFAEYTNHWWNITFSLSSSGLTTGIISCKNKNFEIEFNFIVHQLFIKMDDGRIEFIELKPGTIAAFYEELKDKLKVLGIEMNIWTVPVELDERIPFEKDYRFRKYDPEFANKFWRCLLGVNRIMKIFRGGFTGKASPVHFFWGSMDLAVTFFSGKPAPEHPGAPNVSRKVMVEAYNAELASFGFWGGRGIGEAAFYAYAYPEPENYKSYSIEPKEAYYNDKFREFILPYNAVINSEFPENDILDFYLSAFYAAQDLSNWDVSLYNKTLMETTKI